jgi:hypothetical protein
MKTLLLSLLALVLLVVDPDNYAATPNPDDCCITTQASTLENGQASQPSQSTKTKTEILGRSIAAEIALYSQEAGEVIRENAAMKKLAAQFNSVTS